MEDGQWTGATSGEASGGGGEAQSSDDENGVKVRWRGMNADELPIELRQVQLLVVAEKR